MKEDYPEKRGLDGFYWRVKRDGRYESLCFTDLTEEEQKEFCKGWTIDGWRRFGLAMAKTVRLMGDTFGIKAEGD